MAISIKTNWQDADVVYAADLNRIENNISEMNTTLEGKATRGTAQTITGQWSFQHSDGVKFRRSINGSWYEVRPMPIMSIIDGENTGGMVFNRNNVDLAQLCFNQYGAVLTNLSTNTKYTIIHTGNLNLITSAVPATLEVE